MVRIQNRLTGVWGLVMLLAVAPLWAQPWSATFENSGGEGYCTYSAQNFVGYGYTDDEPCSGFLPLMSDIAYSMQNAWRASSGSSAECSQGTKTLILSSGGAGFGPGAPLRLVKTVDPSEVMDGTIVSFDTEARTVAVDIDGVSCSGTASQWDLFMATNRLSAIDPATPLGIDGGGTGSSTAEGARTELEVPGVWIVQDRRDSQPSSPAVGGRWLVHGDFGISPAGWPSEILGGMVAEYLGSGWQGHTPAWGDLVINLADTNSAGPAIYIRNHRAQTRQTYQYPQVWPAEASLYFQVAAGNSSANAEDYRPQTTFLRVLSGGEIPWTLAGDVSDDDCTGCMISIINGVPSGTTVINVEAAGTIDDVVCSSPCLSLGPGESVTLVKAPFAGSTARYYTVN